MKEYLKYNLNSYLNKGVKKQSIIIVVILISLLFLLNYAFTYYTYNTSNINAQTVCDDEMCSLQFYLQIAENLQYDFIKINGEKYFVESIDLEEVILDNNNNGFQKAILKVKEYEGKNNEIVKLQIFKNKERVITKIFKIIVER